MTSPYGTPPALDYAAVLASVASAGDGERARLQAIADESELAHDAYTLGVDHLQREDFPAALRRLRIALRHGRDDVLPLVEHCERRIAEDERAAAAVQAPHEEPQVAAAPAVPHRLPARTTGPGSVSADSLRAGVALQDSHTSLAYGAVSSVPGTLFALALTGGYARGPGENHRILFGRNRPEVHVCIGEDDPRVSRQQGILEHHAGRWFVRNTGRVPLRVGELLLFPDEDPLPLGNGFTQVFVQTPRRLHLIEVYVTGPGNERPAPRHEEPTQAPKRWALSPAERLALVVLAQRYLASESQPRPLTMRAAAGQLAELQPEERWTPKKVEHLVTAVRTRLARSGVERLTREEVGDPVGNTLNHNLIQELMMSTTLIPRDLALLEDGCLSPDPR
ncbi:FHA domain-containing protein [Amycolatopsis sp. VS8301801F10]|uniref:FHA domain-containing protein n=1 Tax=Amycolatopsis sp. VS8301801F10 TaxID=2652442 RepID=UPI0038FC7B75